jgi:hypothetical protein
MLVRADWRNSRQPAPLLLPIGSSYTLEKYRLKRDGPDFFSLAPVKVAGDERTIMAIVAPHRGETSYTIHPLSGMANLPVCPN